MPQIKRHIIGSGTASAEDTPITWVGAPINDDAANIPQYIDISISDKAVLSSLQLQRSAISTPAVPAYSFSNTQAGPDVPPHGIGPEARPGIWCVSLDFLNKNLSWISVEAAKAQYGSEQIQTAIGSIPINATHPSKVRHYNFGGDPLWQYPDGSLHYIITILRPVQGLHVPTFLNMTRVWYPYSVTYDVTGYELNQYSGDIPDEQISCEVIDEGSQDLYGIRPGKEEQSDFIETHKQACRVGEQIIWQSNKVVAVNCKVAYNPGIRRGVTIRISNLTKNLDYLATVKDVNHNFSFGGDSGGPLSAVTELTADATEYVFNSPLGIDDSTERLDLRQVV